MYFYVKMVKIYIILFIYTLKKIMKTKLTISIDKDLLNKFDKFCNEKSLNKSKLLCNFIKKQVENNKVENE